MSLLNKLSLWGTVAIGALLLAMSWASTVLAEADDGDGFDADEILTIPILLGVAVLGVVLWSISRRKSPKS